MDTIVGPELGQASTEVAGVWAGISEMHAAGVPAMGLGTGARPGADVEVLARAVAGAECALARWMHAAAAAGCLPLPGGWAMLTARGWSGSWARRLARAGAFLDAHPALAPPWSAGVITSEHVDAVARHGDQLTAAEMDAVLDQLAGLWGQLSPTAVDRFAAAAVRLLHPPPDPTPDEADAYATRHLSFAVLGDSVLLSGTLPRLEGELLMNTIEAFADRTRSSAEHVPAPARRADGLIALANAAHTSGTVPSRGGLPVALTVTLHPSATGDAVWTTSRGHHLTDAEARFAGCDAVVTPILIDTPYHPEPRPTAPDLPPTPAGPAARIAALAQALLGPRIPLAAGRTTRTATPTQRRALALRDGGCVIPGCATPPDACQVHHHTEWAQGGNSDIDNLLLLCWTHHRQVDLGMWTIHPTQPTPTGDPTPPTTRTWPANHNAPWIITTTPRTRWRT